MLTSVAEFYEEEVSLRLGAMVSTDRAGYSDFHGNFL